MTYRNYNAKQFKKCYCGKNTIPSKDTYCDECRVSKVYIKTARVHNKVKGYAQYLEEDSKKIGLKEWIKIRACG